MPRRLAAVVAIARLPRLARPGNETRNAYSTPATCKVVGLGTTEGSGRRRPHAGHDQVPPARSSSDPHAGHAAASARHSPPPATHVTFDAALAAHATSGSS